MSKNIEMNIKKEDGYEVLYPNVKANSVIDFTGDNPLLTQETANLFSELPTNPVPNDVLKILSKAALVGMDGKLVTPKLDKIFIPFVETGSYVGTGKGSSGTSDTPTSVTFSGTPSSVLILTEYETARNGFFVPVFELTESYKQNGYHQFADDFTFYLSQSAKNYARFLKESNTLQFYNNQYGKAYEQADENGKKYYFIAFLIE